jgi:hypothetical protein
MPSFGRIDGQKSEAKQPPGAQLATDNSFPHLETIRSRRRATSNGRAVTDHVAAAVGLFFGPDVRHRGVRQESPACVDAFGCPED